MLRLEQVRKSYDGREILNIPALGLQKDIYWIQGENGSGKSTFLKMIAGIIPFSGNIQYDEADVKREPVGYRKKVSWSDAEPLFPEFLTGRELIKFYQRITRSRVQSQELISLFHMDEYIDTKISTYSSGMLKKLSLLLVFSSETPLLLLDEPFITLDEDAVKKVSTLIIQRFEREGNCILMSSHQQLDDAFFSGCRKLLIANHKVAII